jgi:hypothetical protein
MEDLFVEQTTLQRTKGGIANRPAGLGQGTRSNRTLAKKRLQELAAAKRCPVEGKISRLAKTQREFHLAPPIVTNKLLRMGVAFRRNQDSWQVIQAQKCKKKANSYEKYRNTSFLYALR